jgi:hypothetical protein
MDAGAACWRDDELLAPLTAVAVAVLVVWGVLAAVAHASTIQCPNVEAKGRPVRIGHFTGPNSDLVRKIQAHDLPRNYEGLPRCRTAYDLARQIVVYDLNHGHAPSAVELPAGATWRVSTISRDNTLTLGIARRGRESVTFRF